MNYKAILFDLDYTLVDATDGIIQCTMYALQKLSFSSSDHRIKTSIGMSFPETFKFLTNDLCPEKANLFEQYFLVKAKECLTKHTTFLNDAIFALKYLRSFDLKLALVTSKYREEVIELLDEHKLQNLFDIIIAGDDVKNQKPHPEPILTASSNLFLKNTEVVYIGDSVIDAAACEAANVDFIGVTTGLTSNEQLTEKQNKAIVSGLTELLSIINLKPLDLNLLYKNTISNLQTTINYHINELCGYWPPEFGLIRLFEEIGELFSAQDDNYAEEIADIFIISICLANQYCSNLARSTLSQMKLFSSFDIIALHNQLVITTGEIARTINCYEGFKKIKPNENLQKIEDLITSLHLILLTICKIKNINPFQVICKKLIKSGARDKDRFSKTYDPSSALSTVKFKIIQGNIPCVYAKNSKIWGSPEWDISKSVVENINIISPVLQRFTNICKHEKLDVFVIAAPKEFGETTDSLAKFLKELLLAFVQNDLNNSCMKEKIDSPDWQFTFNETRLFITTFASCYPSNNSRYNYGLDSTFIVFQPESSFSDNKMARGIDNATRNKIRKNFKKSGQDYNNKIVQSNIEASRYIKPLALHDDVVRWWE